MRSVCDTQFGSDGAPNWTESSAETMINMRYKRKYRRERCTCEQNLIHGRIPKPFTIGMALNPRLSFRIGLQSVKHDSFCPLFQASSRSNMTTTSLQYCGTLLTRAIKASMTIKRGAGAYSICHTLETARLVPNDSPAFEIARWWGAPEIKSIGEFSESLRNNVNELGYMFSNGIASPYDVDCKSRTLLHVRI